MFRITVTDHNRENAREVEVDNNELHIGRVSGNDVVLPTSKVSKRHARMVIENGTVMVTDLKSTNGTLIREQKITHPTAVAVGETFVVGDFFVRLDAATAGERGPSTAPVLETLPPVDRTAPGRSPAQSGAPPVLSFIPGVTDRSVAPPPSQPFQRVPTGSSRVAPPPVPANATAGHPRVAGPSGATPVVASAPAPAVHTKPTARPLPSHERVPLGPPAVVSLHRGFTAASAESDETTRLFLVSRDAFWDESDFIAHWEKGLSTLLDIVPVDALPATIVSENTRLVSTYGDLATSITDAFVDDGELSVDKANSLQKLLVATAVGLGPLDALLIDPTIGEISVTLDGTLSVKRNDGAITECPLRIAEPTLASRFAQRIHARIGQGLYRGFDVQATPSPTADGRWWLRLTRMPSLEAPLNASKNGDALMNLRAELARRATVVCHVEPAALASTFVRRLLGNIDVSDAVVVGRPEVGKAVGCLSATPAQLKEMQYSPALLIVPALEPGAIAAWLWHRLVYRTPSLLVVGADSQCEALARLAISAALEFPGAVDILTRLTSSFVSVDCAGNEFELQWRSNTPT
jgi:hypothetical protein